MASCTSTVLETWKLSRKRARTNHELDSGKSGKTSFAKKRFCHENRTSLPQRALSDITQQAQKPVSELIRDISAESGESGAAMSGRSVGQSPQVPSDKTRQAKVSFTEVDVNTSAESRHLVAAHSERSVGQSPPGDATVTYVNNLFSPVNKLQAIPLTLDELRRRTEYPEYFGRSEMVAYLRHSKTTGNDLIARYNLKPRSKRSQVNVLSRLCEQEARTLANGIHHINSEYFPVDHVADTMKERMKRDEMLNEKEKGKGAEEQIDNKETINTTIAMLQTLRKSMEQPDKELSKDLEIFERATHTFGCQNIMNHISFVESYLAELQKKL